MQTQDLTGTPFLDLAFLIARVMIGLFGPVGPAIMLAVMVVAAISVHWRNGLFATTNGIELPLLYSIAAVRFALTGPGRYSLAAALGFQWAWTPKVIWVALALGVLGGMVNLALRRRPASPPAARCRSG